MPLFFALMLAALVAIEGHTIHGGVVGPNGEVVANAEVTARRAGDPGFRGFRTTRGWWAPADPASGAFTIDLDDGGYDLVAHAPSFADSDAIRVEVKDGGDDVILRLRRGATIRGRVVSAIDGSPIGGASVMTRAPRDKGREEIRDETEDPDARRATTGDDGSFEMSGLTPATLELRVTHPSWVAETSPLLTVWEGQVQAITVALHKPGSIRGIAYSPPGRRAGTLEVAAMRLGTWQFNHTVATNRRGEFEISGIAPGEYQVTLLDEPTRSEFGYEMRNNIDTRTVVVKDGEVVVVELGSHPEASSRPSPDASARRCIVHGIVRDPNGPVRVTAVAVWNRARQFSSEKCVQDRDGRFTTSRLPPGPSELNVWEGDHVTFSEAIDVPIADDFRHDVLLPTGAITGTIVAASTGKPRPQARAHATVADPASAVDVGVPIATESPRWGPTDDAGSFTIPRLAPGRYWVIASVDDLDSESRAFASERLPPIDVSENTIDVGEIRLEHGFALEGVVRNATGAPLSAAHVTLEGRFGVDDSRRYGHAPPGMYKIAKLKSGEYVAVVTAIGYAPQRQRVRVLDRDTSQDFVLEVGGGLVVRVLDATGIAVDGATIELRDANGESLPGSEPEFPHLTAGAYTVRASKPGVGSGTATARVVAGSSTTVDVTLH